MPNGHGGKPFLATPLILALLFAGVARYAVQATPPALWIAIGVVLAGLAGWSLSYDLHMRSADEYSGAYTSAEERQRAQRRYRMGVVVYALISIAIACAVLWWRGFFGRM
jgi:hypothetical protein